jgi:hypothetical protein
LIARRPLAAWTAARRRTGRAYCELDRWSFDPRYTDGRCPICGWEPPGAPHAPWWMLMARKFEWELAGLAVLAVVLVVLGVMVAHAAGYRWPGFGAQRPASAAQVASPARTQTPSPSAKTPAHATPSPSKSTPSPKH